MTQNPYEPPKDETAHSGHVYESYGDVPFFRKQWFFWLSWLIFAPVALAILFSGNVFYKKKGLVVPFGPANKVVGFLLCVLWIYQVFYGATANI
jgi:hypothetical protein